MDTRFYAKIRRGSRRGLDKKVKSSSARIFLPARVGITSDCEILLPLGSANQRTRILDVQGDELRIYDPNSSVSGSANWLKTFNLVVSGPYASNRDHLSSGLIIKFKEFIIEESRAFRKLPKWARFFLGGTMPQYLRYGYWLVFVGIFVCIGTSWSTADTQDWVERAQWPIEIDYAHLYKEKIGSVPDYKDFRHGVLFVAKVPEQNRNKGHTVQFEIGENDISGEVSLVVKKKRIFISEVNRSCLVEGCPFIVNIPEDLVTDERIELQFIHHFPASNYVISKIFLNVVQPLSSSEIEKVNAQFHFAERSYAERSLDLENLERSRQELESILTSLLGRVGGESLREKVYVLLAAVRKEMKRGLEATWFEAEQSLQLGNHERSRKLLRQILALEKDLDSNERARAYALLERLGTGELK